MRKLFTTFLLVMILALCAIAAPDVSIDVYPRTQLLTKDTQVRVTMRIAPDERNRMLIMTWYSIPEFPNRKFVQIEGAQNEKTFQYYIHIYEPGDWTFQATLLRNDDSTKNVTITTHVAGGF